jgi:hypothetical protein
LHCQTAISVPIGGIGLFGGMSNLPLGFDTHQQPPYFGPCCVPAGSKSAASPTNRAIHYLSHAQQYRLSDVICQQLIEVVHCYTGRCDEDAARRGLEWMRRQYRAKGERPPFSPLLLQCYNFETIEMGAPTERPDAGESDRRRDLPRRSRAFRGAS